MYIFIFIIALNHRKFLETRIELTLKSIQSQIEILNVSNKIQQQIQGLSLIYKFPISIIFIFISGQMNDSKKEYFLRQQLKAIKEELGILNYL